MLISKKHITLLFFTGILLFGFSCKKKDEPITNNVPDAEVETPINNTLKSIYFAAQNGSNVDVYEYESGSSSLVKSISSDFGRIFTDSKNQQIVISGLADDFVVYDLSFNEIWSVTAKNTSFPFFHHFEEGKGEFFDLYVSNEDKEIRSYSSTGVTNDLIQITEANMYPYGFGNVSSGYTFVDVKDYSKSNEELHCYYTSTGQFRFKHDFKNNELIGVGDVGSTSRNALLFVNDAGIGKVLQSNIDTYVSNDFKTLNVEIVDVLALNSDNFLISTMNNGIGIYRYSTNTFGSFNSSINSAQLVLNKEDGRALAVSGNSINFLSDNGDIASTVNHTSSIMGAAIMYE